jgi:hypothetical protein
MISVPNPTRPALKDLLERIEAAPTLWRINGVGTTMLGSYKDRDISPFYHFSLLYFTVLFVPVIPIGIYLVSPASGGRTNFHAKIGFRNFAAVYPGGLTRLLLSSVAEAAIFIAVIGLILGFIVFVFYNIRHK